MEINRRIYYITAPIGLDAKVFRAFKKPQERFAIMRIVSLIRIFQRQEEGKRNFFVNLDRNTLVDTAGKTYRVYLDWLIANNVIEENSIYKASDFSKSYRFTEKAFKKDISVAKWEVSENDFVEEEYKKRLSTTTFTPNGEFDSELLYCIEHENNLVVNNADEILENLPIDDLSYASEWFYKINRGQCFPNPQGRSSRFYLNSIMIESKYRKYISYNNTPLIDLDIKCCHPAFLDLLSNNQLLFNNNIFGIGAYVFPFLIGEFVNLNEFYNKDFYNELASFLGKTREETKVEFNKYKNSDKDIIRTHKITEWYVRNGKQHVVDFLVKTENVWKVLENIETELMCSICNRCIDLDLVFIRQHDGFLTIPEHLSAVNAILSEHPHSIFQYKTENL
jgi:hypothetical protein